MSVNEKQLFDWTSKRGAQLQLSVLEDEWQARFVTRTIRGEAAKSPSLELVIRLAQHLLDAEIARSRS